MPITGFNSQRKRLLTIAAIAGGLTTGTLFIGSQAVAQQPEMMTRLGRLTGIGWGDGYHTCNSSAKRLLADLPPRSYANQKLVEQPCIQCVGNNSRGELQGVYYDRYDAVDQDAIRYDGRGCDLDPQSISTVWSQSHPRVPSIEEIGSPPQAPGGPQPMFAPPLGDQQRFDSMRLSVPTPAEVQQEPDEPAPRNIPSPERLPKANKTETSLLKAKQDQDISEFELPKPMRIPPPESEPSLAPSLEEIQSPSPSDLPQRIPPDVVPSVPSRLPSDDSSFSRPRSQSLIERSPQVAATTDWLIIRQPK